MQMPPSCDQTGTPATFYTKRPGRAFLSCCSRGGGLNATIGVFTGNPPFNAIEEFKGEYRCIMADLRNAPTGQSTGPVEIDRPWESYADDQLGLSDQLGIDKFMVMGFCIGGPFIWSLLKRAPNRIAGAMLAQPVGWRPEMRDPGDPGAFWKGWPAQISGKRPDITRQTAEEFVIRMFETNPDIVSRSRVISCARAKTQSWCCQTMCPRTRLQWQWSAPWSRHEPK